MKSLKLAFLLCLSFVLLAPTFAAAQDATAGQIAIIDIKKILNESKATKGIQEQIEGQRKKVQADVTKQEEALRAEDKKLAEQRSVLSAEAFAAKQKTFKEKVLKAQKEVQDHRGKLETAYNKALASVQEVLIETLKEMAKKRGFKAVIPAAHVAYYDDSLDITNDVLKKLDEKLPSVKVGL